MVYHYNLNAGVQVGNNAKRMRFQIQGLDNVKLSESGMGRGGPLWLPRRHASGESFIRITTPLGLPPGREPGPGTK